MNTLYSSKVDRRNFGDLLSVEGVARLNVKPARDLKSLSEQLYTLDQAVFAIWSQDPKMGSQLPSLLVCEDGADSDWAAWVTTFGARLRPFSAFTRLITRSEFENLATGFRAPELERVTWAAAGLILGEVLAASGLPDRSLETMPANACESTLAFAMFRAAATYSSFRRWRQLVDAWDSVRQATRQHPRAIESSAIARVCATIIEAANVSDARVLLRPSDTQVVHACQEIIAKPEFAPSTLSLLPQFASTEARMHGPREERVVAFSDLVRNIEKPPSPDRELMSLMLGYLASRIAPGTIQHAAVLARVNHLYPTTLLWYGFCAGLGGPEVDSRGVAGGRRSALELPASARRVARDLLRPESILSAPSCDIAVLELLALARTGDDPLTGLIRSTQGTATIELAPAVWTVVNVSSKPAADELVRTRKERDILAAMGEYIDRLREAYSDLVATDNGEAGQRRLFSPKGKKS